MPIRLTSLLTVSLLALAAGAARAEPAPATPRLSTTVAPLIVQGAAPPKVVEKQAQKFVQGLATSPNPELEQIGRWKDPVCVRVAGLPEDQGAAIKGRIEGVAASLGLPPATQGCHADVEIVFTDKPQAVMDAVQQHHEDVLGYYHRHDGVRLKQVTRPIQAWYVTSTLGSSANPTGWQSQPNLEVIDDPDNVVPASCGISHHFTDCLQSRIKNVLVVADTKALQGKDAGLVADYLVMLTLAQPKSLEGCNALPSVIDTLASSSCTGRDAPDGLTPGDASYLTALYKGDPEAKQWASESDIAHRMAQMLVSTGASGK